MNDIQLIEYFRADAWQILGVGFKYPGHAVWEEVNKKLWGEVIPWWSWIAIPSIDEPDTFYLAMKEVEI